MWLMGVYVAYRSSFFFLINNSSLVPCLNPNRTFNFTFIFSKPLSLNSDPSYGPLSEPVSVASSSTIFE